MTWPTSGDSAASTASSAAAAANVSHACPAESGMRSGGVPTENSAATNSSAARAITRQLTGVLLSSPKQPQPALGWRARSSCSAPAAMPNSSAVAARAASAGVPAPARPAVSSSATPRTNSVAHSAIAAGRRSQSGNSAVGPDSGLRP